jgi:hypothetical protein
MSGAFGRLSAHEGGVLTNRISALIKGTLESSFDHNNQVATQQEGVYEKMGPHPTVALISDSQPPEVKEIISAAYKLPSLWYFVMAA